MGLGGGLSEDYVMREKICKNCKQTYEYGSYQLCEDCLYDIQSKDLEDQLDELLSR